MVLKDWFLYVLQKVIDGGDVGECPLKVLAMCLDGC